MRPSTQLLIAAATFAIITWPLAYYGRPYPAFGGESLLLIAVVAGFIANWIAGKEEQK